MVSFMVALYLHILTFHGHRTGSYYGTYLWKPISTSLYCYKSWGGACQQLERCVDNIPSYFSKIWHAVCLIEHLSLILKWWEYSYRWSRCLSNVCSIPRIMQYLPELRHACIWWRKHDCDILWHHKPDLAARSWQAPECIHRRCTQHFQPPMEAHHAIHQYNCYIWVDTSWIDACTKN